MGVQINQANTSMINEIMNNNYRIIEDGTFTKYVNNTFDIIVKNNSSIIVIDKREPTTFYKDLRTAHTNIIRI